MLETDIQDEIRTEEGLQTKIMKKFGKILQMCGTSRHFSGTFGQCPELPKKVPKLPQFAEKFQKPSKIQKYPREIDETLSIAYSRYQKMIE